MKFWQDFRRRRMLQLVGLYIVGAWIVIQVADTLFPGWGIDESAIRFIFYAFVAGFPIALWFGWVFDITSDGIVRTRKAGPGETYTDSLKQADYGILAAMFVVVVAVIAVSIDRIREEAETGSQPLVERRANSIAILPFVNLDPNPDNRYFSDGVTEEIRHRISTLGEIHVLARASSRAFVDSNLGPAEISERLGVDHLLQGSVRLEGNVVRIMAELVDGNGFQVWSDLFERRLENIFAIQSEIASTVASEVTNEIVPLHELPAGRTTTNMEAYNAYLIGRDYSNRRTPGWQDHAIPAYEKAIELDPEFAPPYARLAEALTVNRGTDNPLYEQGLSAAEKALELDPELAEAHAIFGLLKSFRADLDTGEFHLRRAIELDPSLAIAYNWLNFTLGRLGREDESRGMLERGLEVDPINPPMIYNLAHDFSSDGDFEQAKRLLLRLTGLPETPRGTYVVLSNLHLDWGQLADSVTYAKEYARLNVGPEGPANLQWLAHAYSALGMVDDVDYWFEMVPRDRQDPFDEFQSRFILLRARDSNSELGDELRRIARDAVGETDPVKLTLLASLNLHFRGYEIGAQQFEAAIEQFLESVQAGSLSDIDIRLLATARYLNRQALLFILPRLADAYRKLGRIEEAGELMRKVHAEFTDDGQPHSHDPLALEMFATIQVAMGDQQAALQTMTTAVELGWANYYQLVNDPVWDSMLEIPEFQELMEGVRAYVEEQRAIVEAADAAHDFRAEIEALLAQQSESE